MYKGTTPTFILTLEDNVDLSSASDVFVTFADARNRRVLLTKSNDDIQMQDNILRVRLTQQETLGFPVGEILIQLNFLQQDGSETNRYCSTIAKTRWEQNLLNEVLEPSEIDESPGK